MFHSGEPIQLHLPVLDTEFADDEIQQLLSSLQWDEPVSSNSGSESLNREVHTVVSDRKRKRMKSNRESARRSRWKKKIQLENLTEEANRLGLENRGLKNQLSWVLNQCHVAWRENDRLRTESLILETRLLDLYRVLVNMQGRTSV